MNTLFSYFILMIYCLLGLSGHTITSDIIIGFLSTIVIITISYILQNRKYSHPLLFLYSIVCLFFPPLLLFIPMLFLEIGQKRAYSCLSCFIAGMLYHFGTNQQTLILFLLLGCTIGFFLQYLTERYKHSEETRRKMQDDSTELNLLLKQRNRSLLEKQDYEIHNATLQERNRIAREIHDNVGHLLSRCILLNGALQTMNQDEQLKESLSVMQETLSQAMENIRSSVHKLHDDSINLHKNLEGLLHEFTFCPVQLEYDLSQNIPGEVRYALISITKEALTNISRHSNATHVQITLREHPAMYQLSIQDNGTKLPKNLSLDDFNRDNIGIGLINMHDRIQMLHGVFQIHTENGFQIFASIPKQ